MTGLEDGLTSRTRDKFTANVESAKRSLKNGSLSIEFGALAFFIA